jgi:hypothetical protein
LNAVSAFPNGHGLVYAFGLARHQCRLDLLCSPVPLAFSGVD